MPCSIVEAATLNQHGPPRLRDTLSRRAVPHTPVDCSGCICRLLPQTMLPSPCSGRVGVHDFPFRGLLRLHTCYGPSIRSAAQGGPLSQGFDPANYSTKPPASYRANRPLPGWDFHPQGYRHPIGAHRNRQNGGLGPTGPSGSRAEPWPQLSNLPICNIQSCARSATPSVPPTVRSTATAFFLSPFFK